MIKLLAAATMLASQAAAPPAAAPARCLTRQQLGDLSVVGASIFVSGAQSMCRAHLPAGAYLTSPAGERYAASLRVEAERRLDSALAAFERFGGARDALGLAMVGSMLRGLMTGPPPPQLARLADAAACGDLSLMIQAMSNLPPDQIGQFSSAMAALVSRMEHQDRERRYQAALARAAEAPDEEAEAAAPAAAPPAPPRVAVPAPAEPRASPPDPSAPPVPVMVVPSRPSPPRPPGPPFVCPA